MPRVVNFGLYDPAAAPEHVNSELTSLAAAPEHLNSQLYGPAAATMYIKPQQYGSAAPPEYANSQLYGPTAATEYVNSQLYGPAAATEHVNSELHGPAMSSCCPRICKSELHCPAAKCRAVSSNYPRGRAPSVARVSESVNALLWRIHHAGEGLGRSPHQPSPFLAPKH